MKKLLLVLVIASPAFATDWAIDSSHASANFAVRHMTISNVTGTLGTVTGTVTLDEKDITKSACEASINTKELDTRNGKRDEHLRSKEFLDVEKFPTVTFKCTKFAKAGAKLKIVGDLTLHGVTKPVTLDAEISPEITSPFTKGKIRAISASTQIKRRDFGVNWSGPVANSSMIVGDDVKIAIDAELAAK